MTTDIVIYKPNFNQRIAGILFFNANTYRYVAVNENLTRESSIIVFLLMLINTVIPVLQQGFYWLPIISSFYNILIRWLLFSWLVTWIVNKIYKKQIPVGNVIRALGYAHIFGFLSSVLYFIGTDTSLYTLVLLTADILIFTSNTLSVRESCGISTSRALILVLLFTFIVLPLPMLLLLNLQRILG